MFAKNTSQQGLRMLKENQVNEAILQKRPDRRGQATHGTDCENRPARTWVEHFLITAEENY